jgi:hypothetical protein
MGESQSPCSYYIKTDPTLISGLQHYGKGDMTSCGENSARVSWYHWRISVPCDLKFSSLVLELMWTDGALHLPSSQAWKEGRSRIFENVEAHMTKTSPDPRY